MPISVWSASANERGESGATSSSIALAEGLRFSSLWLGSSFARARAVSAGGVLATAVIADGLWDRRSSSQEANVSIEPSGPITVHLLGRLSPTAFV